MSSMCVAVPPEVAAAFGCATRPWRRRELNLDTLPSLESGLHALERLENRPTTSYGPQPRLDHRPVPTNPANVGGPVQTLFATGAYRCAEAAAGILDAEQLAPAGHDEPATPPPPFAAGTAGTGVRCGGSEVLDHNTCG